MSLFDYGNTRLRARLSGLLPIEKLASFADFTSIDSLISALTKTEHKEFIETALTYAHGYECVNQAMKMASAAIYQDLMRFYTGHEQAMIRLIFFRNDLQNLKAIFRGMLHQIPVEQITDSFSHMGTIPEAVLEHLIKSENLADVINRMAVYRLPVSDPLLALHSQEKDLTSAEIEQVMEKWYFQELKNLLRGPSEEVRLLNAYYQIEADIINLNTTLRFTGSHSGYTLIGDKLNDYLIHAGNIPLKRLMQLSLEPTVEKMIRGLFNTRYVKYLRKALECYQSNGLMSEFENQMRMYLLAWSAPLPRRYPLGIGVPIGYTAMKRSEIKNVRWIAKGIESGFEPSYIRDNLERIQ